MTFLSKPKIKKLAGMSQGLGFVLGLKVCRVMGFSGHENVFRRGLNFEFLI